LNQNNSLSSSSFFLLNFYFSLRKIFLYNPFTPFYYTNYPSYHPVTRPTPFLLSSTTRPFSAPFPTNHLFLRIFHTEFPTPCASPNHAAVTSQITLPYTLSSKHTSLRRFYTSGLLKCIFSPHILPIPFLLLAFILPPPLTQ
jgi:hypothetical protein